jgi:WD40 repeat protein
VGALRLLTTVQPAAGHAGEVFSCSFSPDGSQVLSAGWDGFLRLWEAPSGASLAKLKTGAKPLASCTFTPDGKGWLSGSIEGLLSFWDPSTQQSRQTFVAHTRPIAAILYAPDGQRLATASWDRQVSLRKVGKEGESKPLLGHEDIVAGCRWSLDGKQLLSWSHDGTLRLWNTDTLEPISVLKGHSDRITAAAMSPDGRWAVSASRDGILKLWDLPQSSEVGALRVSAEPRACFLLLDQEALVLVDGEGRLRLIAVPSLEVQDKLDCGQKIQCADLAPSGARMVLGGEDGRVYFIAVEGGENSSLPVLATQHTTQQATLLDRFFGKTRGVTTYQCVCPVCRTVVESRNLPSQPFPCPRCHRHLRIHSKVLQLQGQGS